MKLLDQLRASVQLWRDKKTSSSSSSTTSSTTSSSSSSSTTTLLEIEATANPKCKDCYGRGQLRIAYTQGQKIPGIEGNVQIKGSNNIVIGQVCGCVIRNAQKIARAMNYMKVFRVKLKESSPAASPEPEKTKPSTIA